MGPFFFELSGEHPTMPLAEAFSLISMQKGAEPLQSGPGYVICALKEDQLDDVCERIALTHRIGRHLLTCEYKDLWNVAKDMDIPKGTFSIRVKRFENAMSNVDTRALINRLGAVLKENNKVDLNNPDNEVRVFLSDRVSIYIVDRTIDRKALEARKVAERPYFSPISLHPRFARALINMSGVKSGDRMLDPFCGTGGVLLEAASMGILPIASDISEAMVEGCRSNLAHYGYELHDSAVCDIGDIPDHFGHLKAVVTDPPYGRSTSTRGEELEHIYRRALEASFDVLADNGVLGITLPYALDVIKGYQERYRFSQRVHRSLTRHYHVLSKHRY